MDLDGLMKFLFTKKHPLQKKKKVTFQMLSRGMESGQHGHLELQGSSGHLGSLHVCSFECSGLPPSDVLSECADPAPPAPSPRRTHGPATCYVRSDKHSCLPNYRL